MTASGRRCRCVAGRSSINGVGSLAGCFCIALRPSRPIPDLARPADRCGAVLISASLVGMEFVVNRFAVKPGVTSFARFNQHLRTRPQISGCSIDEAARRLPIAIK